MSCEKVTYLIEKKELSKLSSWERIQIRFHLFICDCCKYYEKDSKFLNRVVGRISKITEPKRIISKLDKDKLKEALKSNS